ICIAFFAYYLLHTVGNLLENVCINRLCEIIIIIVVFSGIITGILMLSIPTIEKQVIDLIASFLTYIDKINEGVHTFVSNSAFETYYNEARDWVVTNLGDIPATIMASFGDAMQGIRSFASTLTTIIVSLVTFHFVLFFLLKDAK